MTKQAQASRVGVLGPLCWPGMAGLWLAGLWLAGQGCGWQGRAVAEAQAPPTDKAATEAQVMAAAWLTSHQPPKELLQGVRVGYGLEGGWGKGNHLFVDPSPLLFHLVHLCFESFPFIFTPRIYSPLLPPSIGRVNRTYEADKDREAGVQRGTD